MKLVIITDYWRTSSGGGINTYITGLVKVLDKTNEIKIIFKYGNDSNNYKISNRRFIPILESFLTLKKLKPDVIHVHESYELLAGATFYRILHKDVLLVYTFHTEPQKPVRFVKKIKRQIRKYPYQWALNHCDYITFVSKDLQRKVEDVSEFAIKTKTAITYAGVEKKEISNEEMMKFKKKYGLNQNDIVLLALGMIAIRPKAEGTKILISAIKLLITKYPTIKLLVTRDGKYRKEVEKYANNLGIGNKIIFTGDLDNPLIAVEVADILCQITLAEGGVSLSLLEAMIAKKPIVASHAGGIPEAIDDGENGLLVDLNPELIANALSKLINDKKFALFIGKNTSITAQEKFRWDKTAKLFTEIYNGNY